MNHREEIAKIKTFKEEITNLGGYVYFIISRNGLTKIGKSKNPKKRLSHLQSGSPSELDLFVFIPYEEGFDLEAYLHNMFSDLSSHGEWFNLSGNEYSFLKNTFPKSFTLRKHAGITNVEDYFNSDEFWRDEEYDPLRNTTLPEYITIHNIKWAKRMDPIEVNILRGDIDRFIRTVWRRQVSEDSQKRRYPFARRYFCSQRRPALDMPEYSAIIFILDKAGLIVGRRQGKSGKLILPPDLSIKRIESFLDGKNQIEYTYFNKE